MQTKALFPSVNRDIHRFSRCFRSIFCGFKICIDHCESSSEPADSARDSILLYRNLAKCIPSLFHIASMNRLMRF